MEYIEAENFPYPKCGTHVHTWVRCVGRSGAAFSFCVRVEIEIPGGNRHAFAVCKTVLGYPRDAQRARSNPLCRSHDSAMTSRSNARVATVIAAVVRPCEAQPERPAKSPAWPSVPTLARMRGWLMVSGWLRKAVSRVQPPPPPSRALCLRYTVDIFPVSKAREVSNLRWNTKQRHLPRLSGFTLL